MYGSSTEKFRNLDKARALYLASPDGISDPEVAAALGVSESTAINYRKELGCVVAGNQDGRSLWTLKPDEAMLTLAQIILERADTETRRRNRIDKLKVELQRSW